MALVDNDHAVALRLAEAGFVVLAPTLRSFGDFKPEELAHNDYTKHVENEQDDVYLRVVVNDARGAFAVLSESPGVDPNRVGILGLSLGGFVTLLTAASVPEVAAAEVAGIFIPLELMFDPTLAHECQRLLSLADLGNSVAYAASILPRPLSIQFGENDSQFTTDLQGLDNTQALVDLTEAEGLVGLETYVSPGLKHEFDPSRHIDFFERALSE